MDRPQFHSAEELEDLQYREISALAVAGLVLGLISVAALLTPALWFVPMLGIAASLIGLGRVNRYAPVLEGRKAAIWGLGLSLAFLTASVVSWTAYRAMLRDEARRFGHEWFAALAENKPQVAAQLMENPQQRRPLDDSLWLVYAPGTQWREGLEEFVKRKDVRTLLALGRSADIRYFATEAQGQETAGDGVVQTYAVTFESDEGERQTFFVELSLLRTHVTPPGRAFWQIRSVQGGVRPKALGGAA